MKAGNLNLNYCRFIHIRELSPDLDLDGIDTIIWDLDGTLYSVEKLKRKMVRDLKRRGALGDLFNTVKTTSRIHKERRDGTFNLRLFEKDYRRMQGHINALLCPKLVFNKSRLMIQRANELGVKQALVSEYHFADKLERLGVEDCFYQKISCARELNSWKAGISAAKEIQKRLGDIGNFILIGDRLDSDLALFNNLNDLKLSKN